MADVVENLSANELLDAWSALSPEERQEGFRLLEAHVAETVLQALPSADQAELLLTLDAPARRQWLRILPADDIVDLLQAISNAESRAALLADVDQLMRRDVNALLAYAEDEAGGLMNPRYVRLRPEMSVEEAIAYVRQQTSRYADPVPYAYVLDAQQHLLGVISFRTLLTAAAQRLVRELMRTELTVVTSDLDQEEVGRQFARHKLLALPVVDAEARMQGVVTADDVLHVVAEEATEDIHKMGGMEALSLPYFQSTMGAMIKKRAGWLAVLFIGESFTATAMGYFENELARAIVLTMFIPLIVSSGGNSGSQASTLMIRAMALGEVHLRDWWRVVRRELLAGLALGGVLATIALVRIVAWEWAWQALRHTPLYGPHYFLVAIAVSVSLVGVVLWGTLTGSMLPFLLRWCRFDPASASAPFVATLVDVTGIAIYLSVARLVLRGVLL